MDQLRDDSSAPKISGRVRMYLLLGILLLAVALRLHHLAGLSLWVDEAESSINALTILETGYPTDRYLGLPLYENMLVERWPESREYEFRDSSYSNGMAVYHGWLPLYAIAASLKAFGIRPPPAGLLRPVYSSTERRRMTLIVRLPSVFFGALAVLGIYLAASVLADANTGLALALLMAILNLTVGHSQQARYYSATTAGILLCIWSVVCMARNERWRDFLFGAAAFSGLFYCHNLSFSIPFLIASIVCLARITTSPGRDLLRKWGVFYGLVSAACMPWILLTGFLGHSNSYPKAWRYLTLPQDLIYRRFLFSEFGLALLLGLVPLTLPWIRYLGIRAERLVACVHGKRLSFLLLYLWGALSYAIFFIEIPVASFFTGRLALIVLPPSLLLLGLSCHCLTQSIRWKYSSLLPFPVLIAFGLVSNMLRPLPSNLDEKTDWSNIDSAISYLGQLNLTPATRLYASPNDHLRLTFYSGMSVQDFAPVRKDFITNYPGPIVLFERETETINLPLTPGMQPEALRESARRTGTPLTLQNAQRLSCELQSYDFRASMAHPLLRRIPNFALNALASYRQEQRESSDGSALWSKNPVFNRPMADSWDWWHQFFYFPLGPARRSERPQDYPRLRDARVIVLPCTEWAIYEMPGKTSSR